ncbi:uncharacterized protein BJ171DRAFT_204850 [Polychytrium aggregatum]|uniref:uncharacterized protein n=1 Tax=Polychytrium aggregatum TaxID=110093 RepID=UPI0022FE4D71|nr:uncharacterized protein BJ171DRAFT_204850 [Polychytrium aggregatum]KAI9199599.1 hypothetical protein BJ171DRAFT_204850 [Polychytrium aggregatum]
MASSEHQPLLPSHQSSQGNANTPRQRRRARRYSDDDDGPNYPFLALFGLLILTTLAVYLHFWNYGNPFLKPSLASTIKVKRIVHHLENLDTIARSNPRFGKSRSVLLGYNASAEYFYDTLVNETDYIVTKQPFEIELYGYAEPPVLSISNVSLTPEVDFGILPKSGAADLIDVPIDAVHGGCSAADFDELTPGHVALLVKEGPCSYRLKLKLAVQAKAAAILMYSKYSNPGPAYGRCEDCDLVPAIGITHQLALDIFERIAIHPDHKLTLSGRLRPATQVVTTLNIVAETRGGRDDRVIVSGSHLDSVPEGPGINDDGSGASATLEIALSFYRSGLAKKTVNKVRFAFWSAEELGLLGSYYYVNHLNATNPKELKKIALSLDNDMLASPNYIRAIYDGKNAEKEKMRGPSGVIQKVFQKWFDQNGLHHQPTEFDGRSDYAGFLLYDIPSGGLFTGAEKIKTMEEARLYGGMVGVPYDPCYHQLCDDLVNIQGPGTVILEEMAVALAHAIDRFAFEPDLKGLLAGRVPI